MSIESRPLGESKTLQETLTVDSVATESSGNVELRILSYTEVSPEAWDSYVLNHPSGTVFHVFGMQVVFERTPANKPTALAALDSDGNIVAMLTAVRVETMSGLASRIASRSIFYCEPICDSTPAGLLALQKLVKRHDELNRGRILFSEIRPHENTDVQRPVLISRQYEFMDYLNYRVNLKTTIDKGWSSLSKSCRKQIRKCRNRDVEIVVETSPDSIDQMYELVQFSYDRSGVPLADRELFHNALEILGNEIVEVRLALVDGQPAAAGIVLKFKDVIYAWYGGALRIAGLSPFAHLTWDEIESGIRDGFRYYDFGGAGWPNEEYGPREFKSKFGGELVRFGRYRRIDSRWKLTLATFAYDAKQKLKSFFSSR